MSRTGLWTWLLWSGCAAPERPAPSEQTDARWMTGQPLPTARQECGVVTLEEQVLVIGGFDDTLTLLDTVDAYDPTTDEWSGRAPLPRPLHHPNVAVLDGQVHVAGALGEGFAEIGVHYVYDAGTDSWTELPDLPDERAVGAAAVAVVDGELHSELHLVGGLQLNRVVALHSRWSPETGEWEALPDAPRARDHGGAGVVGGTLVVLAGRQRSLSAFVPQTDRWDAEQGWNPGAPIPTPRRGVAVATSTDGWISVVGGEGNDADPTGVFSQHERYDPVSDSWDRLPPMPTPRHGTGGAFAQGTLWVPGGATVAAFGATTTHEGWEP